MSYSEICGAVQRLRTKYGENDPVRLCRQMGIVLIEQHLGCRPDSIKGFYLESNRIRTITVNADLPDEIRKVIISHELGHAVLHRKSGARAFHDLALFDVNSEFEKEANLFAAELLLDDAEVLDALNRDTTFYTAAAELMVPMELLDFKFRVLKWKGFKLAESPETVHSDFLRSIPVGYNAGGMPSD